MRDVMVDIETLGTAPGSVILSIGAVAFDPIAGTLGLEFERVISLTSAVRAGATVDQDTLSWWGRQDAAAQAVLFESLRPEPTNDQFDVLLSFSDWLAQVAAQTRDLHQPPPGPDKLRMWGNGADFDLVLLAAAYRQVDRVAPWRFWNHRCFRTAKNLFPGHEPERQGVHHNALADARHQARHALAIAKTRRAL